MDCSYYYCSHYLFSESKLPLGRKHLASLNGSFPLDALMIKFPILLLCHISLQLKVNTFVSPITYELLVVILSSPSVHLHVCYGQLLNVSLYTQTHTHTHKLKVL
jgi:hypothetical protein